MEDNFKDENKRLKFDIIEYTCSPRILIVNCNIPLRNGQLLNSGFLWFDAYYFLYTFEINRN